MNSITIEKYYPGFYCLNRPSWIIDNLGNPTGRNVKVAVIDSGCDSLQINDSRILKGISFISKNKKFTLDKNDYYYDNLGHGSACIDRILQIAPETQIIPIKVFDSTLETSTEILVEAINYAVSQEVEIINLSLGTKLEEALYPLYSVCENAKNKNIICIASNANADINSYPAIFENVISVSSSQFKNKFDFIYREDELCECLADGFPQDAYYLLGQRRKMVGNSFAAPIITGITALFVERYGRIALDEVRALLNRHSYKE